jgi:NTP pyrophosphatase (non-canonical NTP hydrolase)
MTFDDLRTANFERQKEWTPQGVSLSFRGVELAGETGEACNVIKKLERERLGIRGSRSTFLHLRQELADVIICVDLIAMDAGINLEDAVRETFNNTSYMNELKTRLG